MTQYDVLNDDAITGSSEGLMPGGVASNYHKKITHLSSYAAFITKTNSG